MILFSKLKLFKIHGKTHTRTAQCLAAMETGYDTGRKSLCVSIIVNSNMLFAYVVLVLNYK